MALPVARIAVPVLLTALLAGVAAPARADVQTSTGILVEHILADDESDYVPNVEFYGWSPVHVCLGPDNYFYVGVQPVPGGMIVWVPTGLQSSYHAGWTAATC